MSSVLESELASDVRYKTDPALDDASKVLLSHKEILAHILKTCAIEFKDVAYSEIITGNAIGKAEVSRVVSEDKESTAVGGGKVICDIKVRVTTPNQEQTELIINIEAQNDFYPGYSLVKRAGIYCGVMLSEQKKKGDEDYSNVKKVYSIWICTRPPKKRWNTIKSYSNEEKDIVGEGPKEPRENYDLSTIVMIYLGNDESSDGLLRLLEILLNSKKEPQEKLKIFEKEFDIKVTKDFEKEVSRMGNISIGIREEAWDEAWKEATSHFIINLMDTLGYTQEEAMKALKISDYEKPKYEDLIRESKAVYEADDKE